MQWVHGCSCGMMSFPRSVEKGRAVRRPGTWRPSRWLTKYAPAISPEFMRACSQPACLLCLGTAANLLLPCSQVTQDFLTWCNLWWATPKCCCWRMAGNPLGSNICHCTRHEILMSWLVQNALLSHTAADPASKGVDEKLERSYVCLTEERA